MPGRRAWAFLNRSSVRHTSDDEIEWFKCDECEFKTKRAGDIKRHKLARHTPLDEGLWFKCGKCEYKAERIETLITHMLTKHEF
jgi:hypothetical protein